MNTSFFKQKKTLLAVSLLTLLGFTSANESFAGQCQRLFHQGAMDLPFNPTMVTAGKFNNKRSLFVSSFYNAFRQDDDSIGYFFRDSIAQISNIDRLNLNRFNPDRNIQFLSDLDFSDQGLPRTVHPNKLVKAPTDLVPFEALVSPQGFHTAFQPGRLVLINLDDPQKQEYIIHQSDNAKPAFYHEVAFHDMDNDGWKDVLTVRSNFKLAPEFHPPFGELVWFKNPGIALQPDQAWEATVLFGGPAAGFQGPDIHLEIHDFEKDGVPEVVATHFFTGENIDGRPVAGKISIFGAPLGKTWMDVNADIFAMPRSKVISADQGFPFGIEIVDLNRDGRADILATNHQPDNCSPMTSSEIPGRVFALEMPASGDLFNEEWPVHILLDDIRPQPSVPGPDGRVVMPGRLAPGSAHSFFPYQFLSYFVKPSIVVGGDEAGKVWVLTPSSNNPENWSYQSQVIFDINDYYGEGTTQRELEDRKGITVSTIGGIEVIYDRPGLFGAAKFYVPVFEGTDIHVLSYRPALHRGNRIINCIDDKTYACPAPVNH